MNGLVANPLEYNLPK